MPSKRKDVVATSKNGFGVDGDAELRTGWRNLLAFWVLGLCNNYGYVVMLSAAHDILSEEISDESCAAVNETIRTCNTVSTGAILLADILPSVIIKLTAPFLPFFVHLRMATCVLFSAAGFLLVSLSNTKWLAIMGVVVTSLSSGLGEVTLLSYSHRYTKNVISTWSSGTGGAGIIGALSYAGLRFFLSSADALLLMLVVPVIQALVFWLVMTHPEPTLTLVTDNGGVGSQEQIIEAPKMTLGQKLRLVPKLSKYMVPLGLVYLFEYFINQGLYELIEFREISLTHCDQYRWLQVDYQIGVFISRSSVNFISIKKIWIMSVLQLLNVILLTFETIYYYIPNIWIVFGLVLWEGLLGGAAYVNTFYRMTKEIPWEQREASLGIASMADSIGIALAGWASMPVHNAICQLPLPKRLGS
ncbi:PREDICTED: battenin [Ceratosolen solmsi marchali]|uniref:Battenin n=1 Tax=Ceratosolen solmsi marchali TaxID=326594 RepID=A0AAJ7DZC5_9HYME|nr:PREDICTED: battenin [Ceratosolen solmsi marchali]